MVCDDVVKDTNKQSYPGLSLFGKGSNVMTLTQAHNEGDIEIYLFNWLIFFIESYTVDKHRKT